jgi:hypothetical protein
MAVGQEAEQKTCDRLVAAQMRDQDRRVEEVDAQPAGSVRRVFRTQAAAERRSRQCE